MEKSTEEEERPKERVKIRQGTLKECKWRGRFKGGKIPVTLQIITLPRLKAKIFNTCWLGPVLNAFYGSSDLNFFRTLQR